MTARFALVAASLIAATPVLAGSGTCLVEVDGRRFVDGSCRVATGPDGRVSMHDSRRGYWVVIDREHGREARAAWNGRFADRPEPLGVMWREGPSCWRNHRGRICAWN